MIQHLLKCALKDRASQRTSLTRPAQNANKVEGYRARVNTHLIVLGGANCPRVYGIPYDLKIPYDLTQ